MIFISTFIFLHKDTPIEFNEAYFLFPLTLSYLTLTIFNYLYKNHQNKQSKEIQAQKQSLKSLNHSLKLRIKDAVQKSKEKDKMLEQQAKMAQMGELLSMISHQWRQPLGSISSAVIALKTKIALEKYDLSKEEDREAFMEYLSQRLDNIENYTNALSTTIDDFKNFYNPNKEIVKADISEPIKRALSIMQSSFERHHISIQESYHDKAIIEHYPNEIMQVILNIINNAHGNFIEKETPNPTISIRVTEEKETVMIAIGDNGGGICEKILDKIFEPYFSTKDEKNGTGLGLYMSKTIVEKHHHGKLSITNKNGGACFTITLPKKLPKSQNS